MSPIQQHFITSPARFKIARSGRRSGKSLADAVYLIKACLETPKSPTLYLGLTRDSAKEAIWGALIEILVSLEIEHEARPSALRITFPNGSFIQLFGADTTNAAARLRGRKFRLVVIDECAFFGAVDALMPVILPTLSDYSGSLVMTSSPGPMLSGFFYEADQGNMADQWERHSWTLLQNPLFSGPATDPKFASRGEEELDTVCRLLYGGNRQHPAFVREYLGQWVRDGSSLVYPFTERNIVPANVKGPHDQYAMGLDLGVASDSAIAVWKYSQYSREAQIVDEWSQAGASVDDLADKLKDFMQLYNTSLIIADTGGLGAASVQELRKRYQLPIKAATKIDKAFFQRVFANDLTSGFIKVTKGLKITDEWGKIVRDENGQEIRGPSNHCFTAGHMVLTSNGYKPIETVAVGDLVLTHNNRWMPVLKTWERDYVGPMCRIAQPVGEDILCTPDHKFWTAEFRRSNKGELTGQLRMSKAPRWVEAQNLSQKFAVKDKLTVADIPINPVDWTKEEGLMLGYWAAEGSASKSAGQVTFAGHEDETRIIPLLERGLVRFGLGTRSLTRSTIKKLGSYKSTDGSRGRTLYITSKPLVDMLSKLGKFTDKRLPDFTINGFTPQQALWCLSGYIYGDGHFDKHTSVLSSSISRELAYQVTALARIAGLTSSLRKQIRAGRWAGIGTSGMTKNDCYVVRIPKREFMSAISSEPELVEMFKDKRNYELPVSDKTLGILTRRENGVTATSIIKHEVLENYTGKVYNLMVDVDNSYTVNNVTVSNCSDAALYAYRYLYNTVLQHAVPVKTEEQKMIEQLTQSAIQERLDHEEGLLDEY